MRAFATPVVSGRRALALAGAMLATAASAAPVAAPGYAIDIVRHPGAIFSGLGRDGDALLVTNLADGRLYRWTAAAGLVPFGPTLPHGLDVIGDPSGPYRAERHGDRILVVQGWTPASAEEGAFDHALLEIDRDGGVTVIASDFWNPYDLAVDGDTTYVIDAARNSIERLDAGGGRVTLVTFPRRPARREGLKALSPTEFSGAAGYDIDAVPTGMTLAGDRLYVALFTGFPFIAGAGEIVSLSPSETPPTMRREAAGLNAPVDVALDAAGDLLVLEHGTYEQEGGFVAGSGRLLRLDRDTGARAVLLDGLTRPVSVLIRADGPVAVASLDGTLIFLTKR